MSFILHVFHLFVNSFKLYCFSSDSSYFSMSSIHASCKFSLRCLTIQNIMSPRMIIKKYQTFLFPLYIFRRSASSSSYSSLVISHFFVKKFRIPLCLKIALVLSFHSSNLSKFPLNLIYQMAPEIQFISSFVRVIIFFLLLFLVGRTI